MDIQEAEWIKASYVAFRKEFVSEMSRHPGAPLDERDMEMISEFIGTVRAHGRTGHRIAYYEPGYKPHVTKIIWMNGAPNLLRWIRDQKFRPKMHEVRTEAERLGMVGETVSLTGETAAQRALVKAPDEYKALPLNDLPQAPMPDEPPSWLNRFPATGNEHYDKIIMNCLLHCSEGKAHATIDRMLADNRAKAERLNTRQQEERKKQEVRAARDSGGDSASKMLRMFYERQTEAFNG